MASLRERPKKDGSSSWAVLFRDADSDGKQTSLTFDSKPEGEMWVRLLNANGQSYTVVERALAQAAATKDVMTLDAAFRRHLKLLTRPNEDTIADYEKMWRNRGIQADLGGRPIRQVTDEHVAEWLRGGLAKYSRKTMANSIGLLSSVFKTAMRRGWVDSNPCELVHLPSENSTERKATFLTVDEFWTLHDMFTERHQLMVRTFVASGLRYSEMTALEVATAREALQRKVPALPVVRAWKESKHGGFYLGAPKAESVRDVSIQSDLAAEILTHIEKKKPDALVFGNRFGSQLRNTTFHAHGWQDAVDAARANGLRKDPRPHDLRHTHASWMLAEGMSVYDLSKRLGHKSTSTTELIYGHLMPKAQTAGAEMIGALMRR
ncbi:site-specific integrase [Microbacterium sp. KR10-403]|uniref:tyrosine-type recombinase/integrase n=1 Tax=Microbacterium sp. KR10-403 TaxID=3158581 RepID=UPI0032E36A26